MARVGKVVYRLDLPWEFSQIHITFQVSQLRKCVVDNSIVVPMDDIRVNESLNYVERSVAIFDRKTNVLHNKVVPLVNVWW